MTSYARGGHYLLESVDDSLPIGPAGQHQYRQYDFLHTSLTCVHFNQYSGDMNFRYYTLNMLNILSAYLKYVIYGQEFDYVGVRLPWG